MSERAPIAVYLGGDCDIRVSGGRARQVARLIAAAPETTEALKKLANETGAWLSAYGYGLRTLVGNTNFAVLELRVEEARAAIAKADAPAQRVAAAIADGEPPTAADVSAVLAPRSKS